jgi:manganese/zinc/iron transport system substrate-binding protein
MNGWRALACAVGAALAWGASFSAAQAQGRPLAVVTTTAHLADLARQVGGDRVKVESLLGEGVDPHLYKPARSDIAKLSGAGLILANGLHLEAQFDDVFAQLARSRPLVLVGERLPKADLLADAEYTNRFDPHIWMDPALWAKATDVVRDALTERDPAGASAFAANAERWKGEIARFADYARRVSETLPPERRLLLTAHDAFGYFGRAFGFEVDGIQGLSTESEAGLRRIEELVKLIVDRRIRAVFVETSVSDANVRAVIEGARARGHEVVIGGELYSDALGAPGTYEGTWLGMIDHNVTVIVRALGGDAPPRGYQGKLNGGS